MSRLLIAPSLLLLSLACGGGDPPAAPASAPPAEEPPAAGHEGAHGEAGHQHDGEGIDETAFRPVDIEGAAVHFVEPQDGATVTSPVKVVFGATNLEIVPAGPLRSNTGHHHLILNGEPVPAGKAVPADDQHIHYGKGQTETEIELPPGEHTLTMQLADGIHRSYGPDLAATITVTVTEAP